MLWLMAIFEIYDKIIEMNSSNDYTTDNLLDYDYFWNKYKPIKIDFSKEIELEDADTMQQIIFIGRLEINKAATMFFIIQKTEERIFNFSKNGVSIT